MILYHSQLYHQKNAMSQALPIQKPSRKHAYIILTPLNPTFIY